MANRLAKSSVPITFRNNTSDPGCDSAYSPFLQAKCYSIRDLCRAPTKIDWRIMQEGQQGQVCDGGSCYLWRIMMGSICVVKDPKFFGQEHMPSLYKQLKPDIAFFDRVGHWPREIAAKASIRRHPHGVTTSDIARHPANQTAPAYLSL